VDTLIANLIRNRIGKDIGPQLRIHVEIIVNWAGKSLSDMNGTDMVDMIFGNKSDDLYEKAIYHMNEYQTDVVRQYMEIRNHKNCITLAKKISLDLGKLAECIDKFIEKEVGINNPVTPTFTFMMNHQNGRSIFGDGVVSIYPVYHPRPIYSFGNNNNYNDGTKK
jgi:hypothetical protein